MLFQQWREIMVDGVGPGACTGMMGSRGGGKIGVKLWCGDMRGSHGATTHQPFQLD